MHIRRKYKMRNSIEVCEFNSSKCPGQERQRRPKETVPKRTILTSIFLTVMKADGWASRIASLRFQDQSRG